MIRLTDKIKLALDNALSDRAPILVASVDAGGQPHLGFRGCTQVLSDDQLAIWVRNPQGAILRNIQANPRVALLYRNAQTREAWEFQGRARLITDPPPPAHLQPLPRARA